MNGIARVSTIAATARRTGSVGHWLRPPANPGGPVAFETTRIVRLGHTLNIDIVAESVETYNLSLLLALPICVISQR